MLEIALVWYRFTDLVVFLCLVKTYELRGKTKSELISTLDELKRELSEVICLFICIIYVVSIINAVLPCSCS